MIGLVYKNNGEIATNNDNDHSINIRHSDFYLFIFCVANNDKQLYIDINKTKENKINNHTHTHKQQRLNSL